MKIKAIAASWILPMTGGPSTPEPLIRDGAVVIDEGRIAWVGPRQNLSDRYEGVEIEEFSGTVLMPGLVNAHTRMEMTSFDPSETPSSDVFDEMIARWQHQKHLTPSSRRLGMEEGIRQSLGNGTTCIGDTGQYVGVVAQAANSSSRVVLFPELSGGGEEVLEKYEGTLSQVDEILALHSTHVGAGLAPYSAYTLSKHFLKILSHQARHLRIPVKIHVAETFAEMQFFYESSGEIIQKLFPKMGWVGEKPPEHRKTPVQYLDSIGFLDGGPALVGCNHLSDPDLQILAQRKITIIHAPRSNARLKSGHPPLGKLKALGIPLALGTDGGSALSLSLWDEMRYIQDHYPEEDRSSPEELLAMATVGGARALSLLDRIGSLEEGKEADMLVIRIPKELTVDQIPSWLVSHVTPREIEALFVAGARVAPSTGKARGASPSTVCLHRPAESE